MVVPGEAETALAEGSADEQFDAEARVDSRACPACEQPAPEGAKFCEACGQDLGSAPKSACTSCGEREVAEDGYCHSCGHKQPAERDHQVVLEGRTGAGSDRGRRHHHNEDAFALGSIDQGAILVVCDGVSSTPGSAEASIRAASAARDLVVTELGLDGRALSVEVVEEILVSAVAAAQAEAVAVAEVSEPSPEGPPSSTLVAAVARPAQGDAGHTITEISVAWLGDSRAYWLGSTHMLLTVDHEIEGSLSRWIGADSPDPRAETATFEVEGTGVLMVCSDGLWRYGSEPADMAQLVDAAASDQRRDPSVDMIEALLAFANEAGGHDNITVAVWSTAGEASSVAESADQQVNPQEGEGGNE